LFDVLLVVPACGIVTNFTTPTSQTSTTVRWSIDESFGKELKPGDEWYFSIPVAYQTGAVRTVILIHRKDQKYTGSVQYNQDGSYFDSQGAYTSVLVRKVGTQDWY
jgi:hypothetical protein